MEKKETKKKEKNQENDAPKEGAAKAPVHNRRGRNKTDAKPEETKSAAKQKASKDKNSEKEKTADISGNTRVKKPAEKAGKPEKPREKAAKSVRNVSGKRGFTEKADNSPKVRIIPLGGLGEIGKNMTLFETDNDMIIIDCGLAFPDDDMFGVDLVIPDFSYIEANSEKLRGVLLTHGHEDHIGAIPYLLRSFNAPIYGTALTIGIIRNKLKEHKYEFQPQLNTVKAGSKVRLGDFEAEFIHVNHSIADACAIALSTPAGTIIHSGDFKLDVSPIEGEMMDLTRFGELGKRGVKLLMCESTNAERTGWAPSEKSVGGVLENVFTAYPEKRIVVATFSSNVHRVMQIIDISVKHGRRVAVAGRSMVAVVSAAIELGYMKPPADTIIDVADMKNYAPGQITLITTGSQGEPMSALYRMAFADHAQVSLGGSDVVVLSSSTIPGNEKLIGRIINELTHNGIKVIYDSVYSGIHASGHACSEEIKLLQRLVSPEYYMPIHGEYRHLHANKELAMYTGIPEERIVQAEIGSVIELGRRSCRITGNVPSGRTLIDGLGVGDVGKAVLRDRKHLAEDGMVIVFASVDLTARLVLNPPEIITMGFVYTPESEDLLREVKEIADSELRDSVESRRKGNLDTAKERVRRAVAKYITQRTGRDPIIIPFITDL